LMKMNRIIYRIFQLNIVHVHEKKSRSL